MPYLYQKPISESLPVMLRQLEAVQLVVLVDENSKKYCYPRIASYLGQHTLIEVPAGEQHKNLDTCQLVWEKLTRSGADRKAVLINLGGGVITDMGGFCAATYKRGIRFINIPTTLLAQVDASVGSKTGVDFGKLKNHIGLFADAEAVLIDTDFLGTLPKRELRSGFAEVIKHALIADRAYWNQIRANAWDEQDWPGIVERSVAIKQVVVSQDPTEKGLRKILNFGHSLGHALESSCLNTDQHLLHGEAIAIGMLAEAYLSYQLQLLSKGDLRELEAYLLAVYPPISLSDQLILKAAELLAQDKKNEAGSLLFSLPDGLGSCRFNIEISPAQATEALSWYQQKSRQ